MLCHRSRVNLEKRSQRTQVHDMRGCQIEWLHFSKVVGIYHRWYLFRVVVGLWATWGRLCLAAGMVDHVWRPAAGFGGADVRRPAASFGGADVRRPAAGFGGADVRRPASAAVSGRRAAVGGRRAAKCGRLTGGGPILFGNLSFVRSQQEK